MAARVPSVLITNPPISTNYISVATVIPSRYLLISLCIGMRYFLFVTAEASQKLQFFCIYRVSPHSFKLSPNFVTLRTIVIV